MAIVWVILTTSQQQTFRHAWFWLHLRRFVKQNHDREAICIILLVCIFIFFFFFQAAGLATMISTMRPDIDNIDEYVRNTTAR